jgi:hypothetical protein
VPLLARPAVCLPAITVPSEAAIYVKRKFEPNGHCNIALLEKPAVAPRRMGKPAESRVSGLGRGGWAAIIRGPRRRLC